MAARMSKFWASSFSSDDSSDENDEDDDKRRKNNEIKNNNNLNDDENNNDDDEIEGEMEQEANSAGGVSTPPVSPRSSLEALAIEYPDDAWKKIRSTQIFIDPLTKPCTDAIAAPDPNGGEGTIAAKDGDAPPGNEGPKRNYTRIVCMSDTHGKHAVISIPLGDILIHAGDFTLSGEPGTVRDLNRYFREQLQRGRVRRVVCIAGNHDMTFDPPFHAKNWRRFHPGLPKPYDCQPTRQSLLQLENCIYLEDASCTLEFPSSEGTKRGGANADEAPKNATIEFYGSPHTPYFYNWAFNKERGADIDQVWNQIPTTTDVLITHGPPLGRGDLCGHGAAVGCYHLMRQVQNRVKPRLMVFGHIHEGYGATYDGQTLFVNASNLTRSYEAVQHCIVVDLPHDPTQPAKVVEPNCPIQSANELREFLVCHQFHKVASYLEKYDRAKTMVATPFKLPLGNDLLASGKDVHVQLCNCLGLHRDEEARRELIRALSCIFAESFKF